MTSSIVAKDDPWRVLVKSLSYRPSVNEPQHVALISVAEQRLYLYVSGRRKKEYLVSTSRFGVGNKDGSYKTPLGLHRVVEKFGANAPLGTIFKARRPTPRIARIYKTKITLPYDLVTTRILRLEGLEPGINKGLGIDTYHRYIYIHGTHEEGMIGQPASIGCVRMRNNDVIKLFDILPKNALVLIVAGYPENKWASAQ
ncbi:MAG: L,D-transpeptidase [Gammaproteobacteria bacterium]|nr:L,D-transpeptidase [Gammaproteobacteria bacterium]